MKPKDSLYINGVFVIIVAFVIAKLFFLSRFHSIIWDEAVYIGMGKYLWSLGHSGLFDVQRPLLLSLIIGFFWKIGLNPALVGELLAVAFSAGLIFTSYLIGKKLVNEKVGFIAVAITATLPLVVLYSSYILTDIPAVLFSMLAIYFFISEQWKLAGAFSAISFLFRFPHFLTVVVMLTSLLLVYIGKKDKKMLKNALIVMVFFGLTVAPWMVFNTFYFNDGFSVIAPLQKANANIHDVVVHNERDPSFYVMNTFKQSILFVFVLSFLFFYAKKRGYKEVKFNVLLFTALVYLIHLSFFVFNDERYILSFIPFLVVLASVGIYNLTDLKNKKLSKVVTIILVVLVATVVIRTAYHDQDYFYWRYTEEPPIYSEYYKFFVNNPVEGTIFTTDPVHAAYVDNRFLASSLFIEQTAAEYEKNNATIAAIVYSPESFPCLSDDAQCKNGKRSFLKELGSKNDLVFNRTYAGKTYYIFERKSVS